MKLSNKDLKELYKAHVLEKIPPSRENCPSPKKILTLLRSKRSEKKKTKTINHIASCHFCMREFELLLEITRNEKEMVQDMEKLLVFENAKEYKKIRIRKSFLPQISRQFALYLAGLLIVVGVVSIFIMIKNYRSQEYRGDPPAISLNVSGPKGEVSSESLLIFRWSEVINSNHYVIEIFDESLYPIWKSDKIFTNEFVPPDTLISLFTDNKVYFWVVTAFLPEGKLLESRIEDFTLKNERNP